MMMATFNIHTAHTKRICCWFFADVFMHSIRVSMWVLRKIEREREREILYMVSKPRRASAFGWKTTTKQIINFFSNVIQCTEHTGKNATTSSVNKKQPNWNRWMNLLRARASKKVNGVCARVENKNGVSFFWMLLFIEYYVHFNTLHMNAHQLSSTAHITHSVFVLLFILYGNRQRLRRLIRHRSFFVLLCEKRKQTLLSIDVYNSFPFLRSSQTCEERNRSKLFTFGSVQCETAKFFSLQKYTCIVIRPRHVCVK